MHRVVTIIVLAVLSTALTSAQSAPAFAVASIKPTEGGGRSSALFDPLPSGYSASNVPLSALIHLAYGLNPYQVVGGPEWVYRDPFTVSAKYPEGWSLDRPGGRAEALRMLQTLLAERFSLRLQKGTREGTTYTMVMARADRRPGPGLRPVAQPCASSAADAKASGSTAVCTVVLGRRAIEMNGQPLQYLASRLAAVIGAPVIDRTGLDGFYDTQVKWTPTETTTDAPPDHVPLLIAIEEQLGLKLERGRGPVDVLVIDSVERPSPD